MECSICYKPIEPNEIKTLSCSHYFHNSCVNSWINTQINSQVTPSCPICRCNTITDISFEENEDGMPALIPLYSLFYSLPDRNETLKLVVSKYVYYLNKIYISTDINEIYYLADMNSYIRDKYKNEFMEYIEINQDFTEPPVLDTEIESLNNAKNIGYIAHLNWWMNKANTFNEIDEKNKCIMMTEIIACHHAIIDN